MAQYMDHRTGVASPNTVEVQQVANEAEPATSLDPRDDDRYWRDNYLKRPYADDTLSYDHYRPAYRYGWESRRRFPDQRWDQVERDLQKGWRENRGESRLGWSEAKLAARDAWQRASDQIMDARAAL